MELLLYQYFKTIFTYNIIELIYWPLVWVLKYVLRWSVSVLIFFTLIVSEKKHINCGVPGIVRSYGKENKEKKQDACWPVKLVLIWGFIIMSAYIVTILSWSVFLQPNNTCDIIGISFTRFGKHYSRWYTNKILCECLESYPFNKSMLLRFFFKKKR